MKTNPSKSNLVHAESSRQFLYCVQHYSKQDIPSKHKITVRRPRSHLGSTINFMIPDKSLEFLWSRWIPKSPPTLKFPYMLISELIWLKRKHLAKFKGK